MPTPLKPPITAVDLHVNGIVQGVGFRPAVYKLAVREGLAGWVLNASDGVRIHLEGPAPTIARFAQVLRDEAPAAARIEQLICTPSQIEGLEGFTIKFSDADAQTSTLVSPDLATCPQCADELFDPANRRYHYPFINCTACGPRFTIIDHLPYDRSGTSMAGFAMCPACAHEYADPTDRRFHAQPDACFVCGPQLTLAETPHGEQLPGALPPELVAPLPPEPRASGAEARTHEAAARTRSDAILARAANLLRYGRIMAIKGLGGFHLACDATNEEAVATLRERKRRPRKPLAIMVRTVEEAAALCQVSPEERKLLQSPARPIVLMHRRHDAPLAPSIAFGLPEVGVMLPSTPLQHLLLAQLGGLPLVMTSGNLSEEPIIAADDAALQALAPIADAILGNDRPIRSRYDDSVMRAVDGRPTVVRRARGLAPDPVPLPSELAEAPQLLACGSEQKATFTLTRGEEAFVSQHLGDLETLASSELWQEMLGLYKRLFDLRPAQLACDAHPEYLASKWAHEQASDARLPLTEVQHHHAHIAAVTGEHGWAQPVVGLALDGTGLGDDGAIWGGEVLVADWVGFERPYHLRYLPLPGGKAAIEHPARMAAGALIELGLADHPGAEPLRQAMSPDEWRVVGLMVEKHLNCPPTSSAGRLCDAASALLGLCTQMGYDGEPAILLEATCYDPATGRPYEDPEAADAAARYRFDLADGIIDPARPFSALLDDLAAGIGPHLIAVRFLAAFAQAMVEAAAQVAAVRGLDTVALGGGVFMNRFLLHTITAGLEGRGLTVLTPRHLPANDGALSYGQAVIALARSLHIQSPLQSGATHSQEG